jgi:AcrR family transcriptional regulator
MAAQRRGPGGSLPDPTVRRRALDALIKLSGERGIENVSIRDVAAEAGISRVTLYSRWPTRQALVIEAYDRLSASPPAYDASSTAREMFDNVFARVIDPGERHQLRQLLAELIAAAGYDADARASLERRQAMWADYVRAVIERGKQSGEIPPDRDTERALAVVLAVSTVDHLTFADPERSAALAWSLLTDPHPC